MVEKFEVGKTYRRLDNDWIPTVKVGDIVTVKYVGESCANGCYIVTDKNAELTKANPVWFEEVVPQTPKQIKLEVGNKYRTQEGNEVKVMSIDNDSNSQYWRFKCSDGHYRHENGSFSLRTDRTRQEYDVNCSENRLNIIEEIKDEQTQPVIIDASCVKNPFYDITITGIPMQELDNTLEVEKMNIDEIKPKNLKEAAKQVAEERTNAEVQEAKRLLRNAQDEVDRLDREIKRLEEQKKPILEILAKFK